MPLARLKTQAHWTKRVYQILNGCIASFFLLSSLIIINGLQTLSLLLRLFSPKAFRTCNRFAANTWWGWLTLWVEKIYGVRFIITGDAIPMRENTVAICNHQSMVDIPVILAYAKRKDRLGDLKWFVKDVLKYMPGVGWGMLFLDCLFIKRNWTEDKDHIHQVFDKFMKHKIPIWAVTFAEGTRITPAKLISSQAYAEKSGLPVLNHLLVPRTKGFVATTQALRTHLNAIYDLTIGYIDGVPLMKHWAGGLVKKVHLHVRRFPIESLPSHDSLLSDWLMKRYQEKDALLDNFYRNGKFPS
jgi:1-acyl-sn-glycerol-3-phosphate acyltransferase